MRSQLRLPPQQTRIAVKINPQSADIYAEGIPATFPSEDGKTVYTALSYNGSTYMPLRTVGRWMGKNISWDSASRTVFLSGHYGKVLSVCG